MHRLYAPCLILILALCPGLLAAQDGATELTLEQSLELLHRDNRSLKIADKSIEWARSERQRISSFWYPDVNISGAYVRMANPIEVREPLSQFTDPAKDFVHSIIPDDQIISSILDQIGTYSLRFPLAPQSLATVDASVTWPLFAGGKRIYAGKIGRTMVEAAEVGREQVEADLQTLLVESYFALRLGRKVVEVREQTLRSLEQHYQDALKLEAQGMIDKAARLFVQVSRDEARRELESARKELGVAQSALRTLLGLEGTGDIHPSSPLFIHDTLPPVSYFKSLVGENNYMVNQLELQNEMAGYELKMGKTAYAPEIALFGKQTLYSHGIQKNLMPRAMVGIGATWNIFDGLNREKKIKQARITQQTVSLTRDKAVDDLGVGIDKLYTQIQNALDDVTALSTTIELSRELVRMRQRAFAEGMATSTEVVDAEVMLSKAEIASLLAYYQYDVALAALLATCGIPETFGEYRREGRTEHYIFRP